MRQPADWPAGLSVACNPSAFNGLKLRVYRNKVNFESLPINPQTYKAQRVIALKKLAEANGFDKVPASWGRKVATDFDQLCKSYGITYEAVTAYVFTKV